MNIDDTAKVLAKIQLGDNRVVDELTLREWHDTIGHLGFEDCISAVTLHRQESADYLMPAHLIRNIRRIRENRPLPPIEYLKDPAPAPENMAELTAAYRSGDQNRVAVELGKYNRQLVNAGRTRVAGWPLAVEPVTEVA